MAIKEILKSVLKAVAPRQADEYFNRRQREHQQQFEEHLGLPQLQARYLGSNPLRVVRGPFAGMDYIAEASGSMYIPKLVGSYEEELALSFQEVIASGPPVVVDIGCAEGYYAVGLARALPNARVYAFDMDERARALCGQLAERNGVKERVAVGVEASSESLGKILQPGAFILSDCEGCESFILDPVACPALMQCDILIELHDHLVLGTTQKLKDAFAKTHEWGRIVQVPRDPAGYPELAGFAPEEAAKLVSEYRMATQEWVFLRYYRRIGNG